jgi:hypothetical protein
MWVRMCHICLSVLIPFNMTFSSHIPFTTNDRIHWYGWIIFHCVHLFICWWRHWSHIFSILSSDTINIGVQMSLWVPIAMSWSLSLCFLLLVSGLMFLTQFFFFFLYQLKWLHGVCLFVYKDDKLSILIFKFKLGLVFPGLPSPGSDILTVYRLMNLIC